MDKKDVVISTCDLRKDFTSGGKDHTIISDMKLEIYRGDFTVIMGSSGAGKSTLLYMLSGMDRPTEGKIDYCGVDITRMNDDKIAVFRRRHCGFVFQQVHLMDSMSIMDNVISTGMLTGQKQRNLKSKAMRLFVVFADEPTGALNSAGVSSVLNVLTDINNSGQSVVMVTHDIKSARRGNRIIYLKDGRIEGELRLPRYVSGDKDRHVKVKDFLEAMGW